MKLSEKNFLKQVIDLAHLHGWVCAHFRTSMNQRGQYLTAVSADGAGFPDLVLVRERVIFAELKAKGGKLSGAQRQWHALLTTANQEVYTWYPDDFEAIKRILER